MELFLKITSTLLFLVLTFHPVLVQDVPETTGTPRRTIDKTWLRNPVPSSNQAVGSEWPSSDDQAAEESGVESGNDLSGGIASGSFSFIEETLSNDTTDQPVTFPNVTTMAPENQDSNVSTTVQLPISEENITSVDNSTTAPEYSDVIPQNSTNNPNYTNVQTTSSDVQNTTSVPQTNATTQDSGIQLSNNTENNATTDGGVVIPDSTKQENISQGSTTASPPTTASPEESTTTVLLTTTSAPVTLVQGNLSDKGAVGTAERGFASDSERRRRKSAWGAVLGTFVAIAVVGLVAYVILKKKHHKAFSHRKLEEEFPSDPVLRLDNSEPLDLNFGRAAYYNPTLQGDNIQMSPFPRN